MKLNKGQGLIGEVIMATTAIIISMTMFIIIQGQGGGTMEQEISQEVDAQLGDIRSNTVMSNVLKGKLHQLEEINKGEYGNLPAYQLISYYFSTPGDEIYIDGEAIDKEGTTSLKSDLGQYLDEKMTNNFEGRSNEIDYFLDIQNFNEPENRPTRIREKTYEPEGSPDFRSTIYLANQEKIHITLYKQGEPFFFSTGG